MSKPRISYEIACPLCRRKGVHKTLRGRGATHQEALREAHGKLNEHLEKRHKEDS
jgi:hypothetical protein